MVDRSPVKVLHVVGARPNFMKVAPVMRAMAAREGRFEQRLVHTGQHYDEAMSQVFFDELGIAAPDDNLEVGSGSHAAQTAEILLRFEPVLLAFRPDWLVVVGDVNSTMAATLVASKLGVRTAHVEAGLRSFDRGMPEEINRLVTDALADLLLTPEPRRRREPAPGRRPRVPHPPGRQRHDRHARRGTSSGRARGRRRSGSGSSPGATSTSRSTARRTSTSAARSRRSSTASSTCRAARRSSSPSTRGPASGSRTSRSSRRSPPGAA